MLAQALPVQVADAQISLSVVMAAGAIMAGAIYRLFAALLAAQKAEVDRMTTMADILAKEKRAEIERLEGYIVHFQKLAYRGTELSEGMSKDLATLARTKTGEGG